ncbi:hypothetical protein Dda_9078 [Drechslerella dactyloides]|uniref:Ig-like domain-containing protein n=1 Tax=Drechslerella dactyloides TaxID=74499 RepID=A0AAD6IQ09_DREDA|nr:hypothetical protein Dda_9078 [Drechslerella dactyloides]
MPSTSHLAHLQQMSSGSTVEDEYPPHAQSGPVSLLFDYTLDFGREHTIVISRLREPSEIPRPADYVELLPVAYYLSVDPRFRLVLLSPTYDTVAAISFVSFQKPVVEVQEQTDISARSLHSGSNMSSDRVKLSCRWKGAKTRFSGDRSISFTWERQGKDEIFDLWVTEALKIESPSFIERKQTRRVGTMKRSTIAETDSKRVVIEANTRYIGEVAMLASALTILKKDALEERQKKAMADLGY